MTRDDRSESGLTLVELLVTVVILSLIIGALASSFITAFNASRPASERTTETNDAQLIASFLVRDAQAAGGTDPTTVTPYSSLSGFPTTPAPVPVPGVYLPPLSGTIGSYCQAPGTAKAQFDWNDRAANTATTASFAQPASGASVTVAVASNSSLTTGETVLIASGGYYTVVLTTGSTSVKLTNLGFAGNAVTGTTIASGSAITPTHGHIVIYSLSGTQFTRTSCIDGQAPATITLGNDIQSAAASTACDSGTCMPGLPTSVSLDIVSTNPTNAPSAYKYTLTASVRPQNEDSPALANASPVPLLILGSGGNCSTGATGIRVSGSGSIRVYGDTFINATDGATCDAMNISNSGTFTAGSTSILQGGSCTFSGASVCPTTTSYSPALGDPFAGLIPPSPSGLPSRSGCPGGIAQPGVYASTLALQNVDTCQMQSGVYILQNGLSMANSAILTSAPGGVLIYITGGTFSIGGAASVTLSTQSTGPYSGLVIWQASSDANTMAFGNSGFLALNGVVYAPKAEVNLTGAATNPSVTAIVAQSIVVGNSGVIVIGTPLTITGPPSLVASTVNKPYPPTTATAAGGAGTNVWSMTGNPAGLSINANTGVIAGTPTASGTFNVTVKVTDIIGDVDTQTYSLTINAAPSITTASLPDWTVTFDYHGFPVQVAGGTAPYTWSASGLPTGLSINGSGVIVGSPSAVNTFTPTITVTDSEGATTSRGYTVHINSLPSISGPATLPTWTVGVAYPANTITATSGTAPYTWSASGLPPPLTINAATGAISTAMPTVAGTYSVTVTATDVSGAAASKPYSVTINAAPGIGANSLPNGEINQPYNFTVPATGGTPPYTFTTTNTNLPNGLSINAAGVISGTPSTVQAPTVTIKVKDSTGFTTTKTFTLTVVAAPTISAPATLVNWTIGRDYPGTPITVSNGVAPFTWSATGLPTGVSINAGTGVISGTPTVATTFTATVKVIDSYNVSATKNYTVIINPAPAISTASLPNGEQSVTYTSTTMAASGGTTPYTWSATGLTATGLSINVNTGVISGTPSAVGTFSITISAVDAAGATASHTYSAVTINPTPSVTSPATFPSWTSGRLYPSQQLVGTGGTGAYTFTATGVPNGLTLNGATGLVSGTPTTTGAKTLVVTIHDAVGGTSTQTYTFTINTAPAITTGSLAAGTVGFAYPNTQITSTNGTQPFNWSATGLPTGMGIDPGTGMISGTPTVPGTFSVVVSLTDAAGAIATHAAYSLKIDPAATVTSTTPSSLGAGATQTVAISGTGFINGGPLAVAFSGTGITVNTKTFVNATTINVNITISSGAASGLRDVTVTNGDGSTAIGTGVFTVNAPPTITLINPASHARGGAAFNVTITGVNFVAGTVVAFSGTRITLNSTTFGDSNTITVNITLAGNAQQTARDVTVTNPDGGTSTVTGGFTVT